MKKKVKEILIIIFISSILFIIVDFLGSSYLVKSSENIYEKKKNMDIMSYQILLKVLNFLGAQFIKSLLINMVLEVRQALI